MSFALAFIASVSPEKFYRLMSFLTIVRILHQNGTKIQQAKMPQWDLILYGLTMPLEFYAFLLTPVLLACLMQPDL